MPKAPKYESSTEEKDVVTFAKENGHVVRAESCIFVVACPACRSPKGSPCLGRHGGFVGYTHFSRRDAASDLRNKGRDRASRARRRGAPLLRTIPKARPG